MRRGRSGSLTYFWRGRRVFLTGHTGFKGSWLALWLAQMGAEVTGYALAPPTDPSLFALARVGDLVRDQRGDVTDAQALASAVRDAQPEVVLHLAAQALVRPSYEDPVGTYATNVMGTVHLLEGVRQTPGVRAVVCVTSDKCYENGDQARPYREDDPMGGYDPYSSSKGCSELVTSAYRRSFFHPRDLARHQVGVASARAGNVIGGGDWARDRLIPDLLKSFSAGERPLIRFPDAVRPWQHVLEPLHGYLILAQRLCEGRAEAADGWNFGPDADSARPVGWIADRLAAAWGQGAGWDRTADAQPHEAGYLSLDSDKARAILGWRPVWSLEETLAGIVQWQRDLLQGVNVQASTLDQIRRFEAAVAARTPSLVGA